MNALETAYMFHRSRSRMSPVKAMTAARADVANGTTRYYYSSPGDYGKGGWTSGRTDPKTGHRFVDDLASAGLRLVGYSDEIVNLRHKGWFTDEDQSETLRGAVVQLPGRDGHAVCFAAYQESANDGWIVDMSPTYVQATDVDNLKYHIDLRDLARTGDSMAENAAETERDYQSAWRLGSDYAALQEEIAATRKETLAILAEFRAARKIERAKALKALCATIQATVRDNLYQIRKAREKCAKILADNYFRGDLASAFNDGAGEAIV